jgi:hypothetical protein
MNRWYQIRKMRGAAILILVGILALLSEWHVLGWDKSWPLILIVLGLMALVERAAWSAGVREQQATQGFGPTTGPGTGTIPPTPSYWSPAAPSNAGERPIEPQPPAPENPGREDR